MKPDTKDKIIVIVALFFVAVVVIGSVYEYYQNKKNPSLEGTNCYMKAEEQKDAYGIFFNMKYLCEKAETKFYGIKEGINQINKLENCNQEYCCYDIDLKDKFYCITEFGELKQFVIER